MKNFLNSSVIILGLFFSSNFVSAQTIETVEGKKVTISVGSAEFEEGSKVFAYNDEGKKKALIEIKSNDGMTAKGIVLKGKAEEGFTVGVTENARRGEVKLKQGTFGTLGGRFITATLSAGGYSVGGSGFGFYGDYGSRMKEIAFVGEFRYSILNWSQGGSNNVLDLGIALKYQKSKLSFFGAFDPISQVSGNGASTSGSTFSFGGAYDFQRNLSAVVEYRMTSFKGSSLNGLNLGLNMSL